MFGNVKNCLVSEEELDGAWQRLLSLAFLLLAGVMSFFSYTYEGFLWNSQLSFAPEFVSSIMGIILVAPLYLRNILKWTRSVYGIISLILILLVFGSFVQLAIGGNNKSHIVLALIAISVVLSWLGIKSVAGISWVLVLAAAVFSVLVNQVAFGFGGFIYVTFGFLGLLMHTGLNPGALMRDLKNEYSRPAVYAASTVKEAMSEAVEMGRKIR